MKYLVKFNESKMGKYQSIEQRIKSLKDDMLKEILADSELTKPEKLELISRNKLFKIASYIQHPFSKYNNEFIEIIRRNPAYTKKYPFGGSPSIDDIFCDGDMYEKHQIIYLYDVIENYSNDYADDDSRITILTNRSTNDKFKISKEEFVDCIYDWCVVNKTIAFEMDW